MKVTYDTSTLQNPLAVLRKAGYSSFTDPKTGDESFVLRLTSEFYPRFHLYVEEKGDEISLNLHLDQKQPSYGTSHAHSGEYDGPMIEKEMRRIVGWVHSMQAPLFLEEGSGVVGTAQSKPWWKIW